MGCGWGDGWVYEGTCALIAPSAPPPRHPRPTTLIGLVLTFQGPVQPVKSAEMAINSATKAGGAGCVTTATLCNCRGLSLLCTALAYALRLQYKHQAQANYSTSTCTCTYPVVIHRHPGRRARKPRPQVLGNFPFAWGSRGLETGSMQRIE